MSGRPVIGISTLAVLVGIYLVQCSGPAPSPMMSIGKELRLLRGSLEIDPSQRTFVDLGPVPSELSQDIGEFLKSGHTNRVAFVATSEYYLQGRYQCTNKEFVFGIVRTPAGKLCEIDITNDDARGTWITGFHLVVINEDKEMCATINRQLTELIEAATKTPSLQR